MDGLQRDEYNNTFFRHHTMDVTKELMRLLEQRKDISKIQIICFGRNGYGDIIQYIDRSKIKVEMVMCNPEVNAAICRENDDADIRRQCSNMLNSNYNVEVYVSDIPPAIRAATVYAGETPVWSSIQSYQFERKNGNLSLCRPTKSLIVTCDDESQADELEKVVNCFEEEFNRLVKSGRHVRRVGDTVEFIVRK